MRTSDDASPRTNPWRLMLRFELGAFHIAQKAEAPLVPLVLHGTRDLWPMGQVDCRPGTVTVRLLSEVPAPAPTDEVQGLGERHHEANARELELMRATVPVAGMIRSSS